MKPGRDILSEYGNDAPHPQAQRASSGGVTEAKPLNYHAPYGPTNMHHQGPGIPGHNHGMAARPVASGTSGCPGNGGTVHRSGSQRG